MRLPSPLLRRNPNVHKNDFGHVLVVAGSESMLGAASLTALAAMRSGAGLVTCAVSKELNLSLQKKISPVIMTMPLPKYRAYDVIAKKFDKFHAIAIGPGLGQRAAVCKLVYKIVESSPKPLVIDADALNILAKNPKVLLKSSSVKILTPHAGEMARLIGKTREFVEKNGKKVALEAAATYKSIVVLKHHHSIVASPEGKFIVNSTGNAGMATAGSGDVLTGMIAGLMAQGIEPFTAAQTAVYLHGRAGDRAVKHRTKASLIATDLIDEIGR